jgi:hypothetical protein
MAPKVRKSHEKDGMHGVQMRTRAASLLHRTHAAVTTAVLESTHKLHKALHKRPLAPQDERRANDMRSLTSIGGVSQHTLAKQLAFLRKHPEVHILFSYMRSPTRCGNNRVCSR